MCFRNFYQQKAQVIQMARMSRGPGGGTKKRLRTTFRKVDQTTYQVMRNRSTKLIPANWRELLAQAVLAHCDTPPKHFKSGGLSPAKISRPGVHIALGSLPTGMIEFTLDRDGFTSRWQHRAIDWALRLSDVNTWPVPKPAFRIGAGGECFVNTHLSAQERHSFNASRLQGIEGIDWQHLEQYTARYKKGRYLGVKTTCGEPCSCRRTLPVLWQLGWEMHY